MTITLKQAKTADAIIAYRTEICGWTQKQLLMFGVAAPASQVARVLKCSVSTARNRLNDLVVCGIAHKSWCCNKCSYVLTNYASIAARCQ